MDATPLMQTDVYKSRGHFFWRLKVGTATVIFCLSVSAVPIYNKLVFAEGVCDGKACLKKYPYPMATAFLQLSLVSLVLALVNIVGHLSDRDQSWILGPHYLYKIRHVAPVGLLFGFKYAVTNWGLQIVPVGLSTWWVSHVFCLSWLMELSWNLSKHRRVWIYKYVNISYTVNIKIYLYQHIKM